MERIRATILTLLQLNKWKVLIDLGQNGRYTIDTSQSPVQARRLQDASVGEILFEALVSSGTLALRLTSERISCSIFRHQ